MVDLTDGKRLVAVFTEPASERHRGRVAIAAQPRGEVVGHEEQNVWTRCRRLLLLLGGKDRWC